MFALIYVIMGAAFIAIPFVAEENYEDPKRAVAPGSPEIKSEVDRTAQAANEPVADKEHADPESVERVEESSSVEHAGQEPERHDYDRRVDGKKESAIVGAIFVGMGLVVLVVGFIYALTTLVAGRGLAKRKWRGFSMFIAGVHCLHMPIGTVLGVFTLIVLLRPSVKSLYEAQGEMEPESKPATE